MRKLTLVTAGLIGLCGLAGCQDNTPPPRVAVPPSEMRSEAPMRQGDPIKPLPAQQPMDAQLPPPPFDDVPLLNQPPPEEAAFVDAYGRVGRPRFTVFVNRTLEGDIIPANPHQTPPSLQRQRSSNGEVLDSSGHSAHHADPNSYDPRDPHFLGKGQYDEAWAKSLDYEAVENTLADWIACDGKITMISPSLARQRLTDDQVKELQSGRPQVLAEIAEQLGADVLIHVQAHPTQQYQDGLRVRVVAEAVNTKGGVSLGRVVADVPLPLEKTQINRFTRFMARKLMDEITNNWLVPAPPAGEAPQAPQAPQQSAPPTPPQSAIPAPPPPPSSPPAAPMPPPMHPPTGDQ